MPQKNCHILIIRLSAMGDVAMTVPVLRALLSQNPHVSVTMVSRPFFEPFFKNIPNLNFFAFDQKNKHKGFMGLLRLFLDLKKLKPDAFADLHTVIRSIIIRKLFFITGVRTAFLDKGRAEKKKLTSLTKKNFEPLKTSYHRYADVFRKLGFGINLDNPTFTKLPLSPAVIKFIGQKNISNPAKYIGIAPFAQYPSKVYPSDLMQKVLEALSTNTNYKIFLFGNINEKEKLNKLAQNNQNIINTAGAMNFRDELILISNLDLMLSMDSANGHIAAMYGTKVITLWGATHPFAGFAPFNQPLQNSITADRNMYPKLPTSIYGNKIVDGYEDAMRTIAPEMVIKTIENNL